MIRDKAKYTPISVNIIDSGYMADKIAMVRTVIINTTINFISASFRFVYSVCLF